MQACFLHWYGASCHQNIEQLILLALVDCLHHVSDNLVAHYLCSFACSLALIMTEAFDGIMAHSLPSFLDVADKD
jgi:hypothetical protein